MKNMIIKWPKLAGFVLFIVLLLMITATPGAMQAESGLELAWGNYGGARGISSGGGYEVRGNSGWLLPRTVSGTNYTLSTFLNVEVPYSEQYTLAITVEDDGSSDPAEGTHTYAEGEAATVTATPDAGWPFVGWSGDASGTNPEITVIMEDHKSITAVFEAEDVEPTFIDVGEDHPFFTEIEALAASGIAEGWPDGTFRPTLAVTRQAMAAFLYRGLELEIPDVEEPTFIDVGEDHTFFKEIEALAASGITTGWPDGTFRPTLAVTRQAMAAFLYRGLELGGPND